MRLQAGSVLVLLVAGALASQCTNKCNADNCLRAVRATSHTPFPASASADCSSFLRKTVTPCAATTTSTVLVTNTIAPVLVTDTTTVDVTQLFTVTDDITTTDNTVIATVVITSSTLLVETETVLNTATVTLSPVFGRKRGAAGAGRPLPAALAHPGAVERRSAVVAPSSCTGTTNSASAVPTYASACSGTARYSSACSCDGVTASTTTLAQQTVTVTTTSTVLVTPTSTVDVLVTSTIDVTVTATSIIPETLTIDITSIDSITSTSTFVLPITTTVSIQPACTTTYDLVAASGTYQGQYINAQMPGTGSVSYGYVTYVSSASSATPFYIDSNNYLTDSGDTYAFTTMAGQTYYVLNMDSESQLSYNIPYLSCSIDTSTNAGVTQAVGVVSCKVQGTTIEFGSTGAQGTNLLQSPNGGDDVLDFTEATLAAIPVGCL